jgi:hypothetical protein
MSNPKHLGHHPLEFHLNEFGQHNLGQPAAQPIRSGGGGPGQ